MSIYDLPKFELPKPKALKFRPARIFWVVILIIFVSSIFGFLAGAISGSYFYLEIKEQLAKLDIEIPEPQKIIEKETIKEYIPQTSQEEKIIQVIESVSPAVVSIVITIEKKEIGGGTGFIVSKEGMTLTNRHVVLDREADYTILTNDGREFSAKVLARDPIQDLAIIKIDREKIVDEEGKLTLSPFPVVKLGDSEKLQIGQTVIAIGNVLGEFRNSVSVGVISGLGRTITAVGGGLVETIEDVIQTDAAINKGNSGGPLLNLKGEVVGINTAVVLEAQSIGFAIPINKAKKDIEQVKTLGKIVYPFLGVRYVLITERIQRENNLPVDYGAWIVSGKEEPAISPDSAAQAAGLKEDDIILEFNGEKITLENSLAKIIMKYNPGDKIVLKILSKGEEKIIQATLDEKSE